MTEDNEYQKATKIVVDDAMRIDILGPNVCKVLKEHTPTGKQVKKLILNAINEDADVRKALGKFNDDQSITRKGKGLTHIQAIALTAAITLVITLVGTTIYDHYIK